MRNQAKMRSMMSRVSHMLGRRGGIGSFLRMAASHSTLYFSNSKSRRSTNWRIAPADSAGNSLGRTSETAATKRKNWGERNSEIGKSSGTASWRRLRLYARTKGFCPSNVPTVGTATAVKAYRRNFQAAAACGWREIALSPTPFV